MFYPNERIALIIDGVNLHGVGRTLGFEIDYNKLRKHFATKGRLLRASYFTTTLENEEFSSLRGLIDWLHYNGFKVSSKAAREFTDSQGHRKIKGTMNVEMAVEAMELAKHVDHLVLFSGDGELRAMVGAVQRMGVRVSVVSSLKTSPPMVSDDLRRQADNFIDFADLQEAVERPRR
jgi:uncharacterized LabA/DUF88 family protein